MIVDYHMHLRAPDESLDHSVAGVERFVETAQARGVDEIGLSEHVYYFRETAELWDVPYMLDHCRYELEPYCEAVLEAKRQGLPVKLGIEVDWFSGLAERTAEILEPYPWDYLLGSVHFIDGLGIDARPSLVDEVGSEAAWARYFRELADLAASGLVDVLAHADLVKFFGDVLPWDWGALVDSLHGVCIEVSTAGRYKPHGRVYPELEFLREARRAGIPITLASDAHVPANVGRDFDHALAHAREAGYDRVAVFESRRFREEPLG